MSAALKVLLVGPLPPPHGGISVHVATAHRLLGQTGVPCEVVAMGGSGASPRGLLALLGALVHVRRRARRGWLLHVHGNGHNARSWLVAILSALAARSSPGRVLTIHSGMAAPYMSASVRSRSLARVALRAFDRIVCVNREIAAAVAALGTEPRKIDIAPARLPEAPGTTLLPDDVEGWLAGRHPVLAAVLTFRPEYGFGILVEALAQLKAAYPELGCLVIGGGGAEIDAREILRRRRMEDWVRLTGDVAHGTCLGLLSRSDLFLRPTLADGDAVSVREAQSLGLPVVASDVGTRPAGVHLVPPGDARALAEAAAAALHGSSGRRPETPDPAPLQELLAIYDRARARGRRVSAGRTPASPRPALGREV